MRDTIDLWHKVWPDPGAFVRASAQDLERFEALIRADEREQSQKWFDAVTAQHKQLILAEREACAKWVDHILKEGGGTWGDAIRNRGDK
jgi:hypothetical protein